MNKNRLFLALLGFFNILNLNADDKKQQPPAGYDARVDWMKLLQYRQSSLPELFETFLDSINRNELNNADLIFRIMNLYNRNDDEFQKLADKYPNESFPVRTPAQQAGTSAVLAPSWQWGGSCQWGRNKTPDLDGIKNKLRELWESLPEDDARRDLVDLLRLHIINQKHILENRPVDGILRINAVGRPAKDEDDLYLLKLIIRLNGYIESEDFKERIINKSVEKGILDLDIRNLIQKKDTSKNRLIRRLADDVLEKLRNFFEMIKEEE